jgi:hypothetical protein
MNVVDSFVTEIGLDDSKFKAAMEEAAASSTRLRAKVGEDATASEGAVVKSFEESFTKITRQVLQLFFLFLGARGITDFVDSASRAETALGIMAQSLATTPEQLSAFDQAVERVGGTSEGANASLSKFSSMIMEFNLQGVRAPDWFYRIGGSQIDPRASRVEQFVQLSQLIQQYRATTAIKYHVLEQLGLDQYTSNLILQGPIATRAALAESAPTATTGGQVESGQRMVSSWARTQQSFQSFGRKILENVQGPMADILDRLSNWAERNQEWIAGWFGYKVQEFVTWVESLDTTGFINWWQQIGEKLNAIAESLGGWETVGTAAVAIWGASKVGGLLSPIAGLLSIIPGPMLAAVAALSAILFAYKAYAGETPKEEQTSEALPSAAVTAGTHSPPPGAPARALPASEGYNPTLSTVTLARAAPKAALASRETGPPPTFPLETVEGPVSMARPLPVRIMNVDAVNFGALLDLALKHGVGWLLFKDQGYVGTRTHEWAGARRGVTGGVVGAAPEFINFANLASGEERSKYSRGVQNFNPGNIAWGAWAAAHGATGGLGEDTGHQVAVFPDYQTGIKAMETLALSKYQGGKTSTADLIAGTSGWTPGNIAAADNVARSMGLRSADDLRLNDPEQMRKFVGALTTQEVGPAGARYIFGNKNVPTYDATAITTKGAFGSEVDKFEGYRADTPNNLAQLNAYMKEAGIPINAENTAWCAAWVNAQLAHEGVKGTGSAMAASFFAWGKDEAAAMAKKGDVMVTSTGSHVGRFTGKTQIVNGRIQYEMESGNAGEPGEPPPRPGRAQYGGVERRFYDPGSVRFRQPPEVPKPAADSAAAGAKTSILVRKHEFNVAHLQVHSHSTTASGLAKDVRVALQRELEQNLAVG